MTTKSQSARHPTLQVSAKRQRFGTTDNDKPKKPSARRRPVVQVVTCPSSDFPTSSFRSKSNGVSSEGSFSHRAPQPQRQRSNEQANNNDKQREGQQEQLVLDWKDTTRQVRAFASTAFSGKTKRQYREEEYERLTGRKPKQQKVPIAIVKGIRKKARQRQEQLVQEAKLNGVVLASASRTTTSNQEENKRRKLKNRDGHVHGPAPSIGYVKGGVFRVQTTKKRAARR